MADSSFDPLGIVKAMGPQRDPYSWAELYAADAAKQQSLREELKNRLLVQEMTRAERAKEGQLDRESREKLATQAETGRNVRWKDRVEGKVGAGALRESRVQPLPKGSLSETQLAIRNAPGSKDRVDVSGHDVVVIGGHTYYVPPSGGPATPFKPRMVPGPARSKYDDDEED
jgi:hypothetical protein